jgi:phage gpG-like protein
LKFSDFQSQINATENEVSKKLERAAWRISSILELQGKLAVRNNPRTSRAFGGSKKGLVNTGALLNSIKSEYHIKQKNNAIVTLGSYNVPYAAIHEFGGVIKARGKYLTIPANAIARQGGGLRVRNYPNKLYFRGNGTKGVALDATKSKDDPDRIAYYLKNKVTIPARPYLRLAIERSEAQILKILEGLPNAE